MDIPLTLASQPSRDISHTQPSSQAVPHFLSPLSTDIPQLSESFPFYGHSPYSTLNTQPSTLSLLPTFPLLDPPPLPSTDIPPTRPTRPTRPLPLLPTFPYSTHSTLSPLFLPHSPIRSLDPLPLSTDIPPIRSTRPSPPFLPTFPILTPDPLPPPPDIPTTRPPWPPPPFYRHSPTRPTQQLNTASMQPLFSRFATPFHYVSHCKSPCSPANKPPFPFRGDPP